MGTSGPSVLPGERCRGPEGEQRARSGGPPWVQSARESSRQCGRASAGRSGASAGEVSARGTRRGRRDLGPTLAREERPERP